MTSPPVKYVRQADYTSFEAAHPTDTKSGVNLDADFGAVLTSLNQTIDRLGEVQRSDGRLVNGIVTSDTLSSAVAALLAIGIGGTVKGAWAALTAYVPRDVVTNNNRTYLCVVAHASAALFATDLAASKWVIVGFSDAPISVATIAALKTFPVSVLASGTTVQVAGYYGNADGGGGNFVLTTVNPGADNGGTIIWSNTAGYYFVREFAGAVSAKWFGAKGDAANGVLGTDDLAALNAWMAYLLSSGHVGWLPPNKFRHTATLTVPIGVKIFGVPGLSYFQPWSTVATAAVVQSVGSTLEGVKIYGFDTANIIGLSIGTTGLSGGIANNGFTRQVQVTNFVGAALGVALQVKTGVIWSFEDCYFGDGTFSTNIVDSTNGTPTTLTFTTCVFKGNTRRGFSIYTGQECQLIACIFENNGEEGLHANVAAGGGGSAALQNLLVVAGYFESNQTAAASGAARHALYHAYLRGDGIKLRDCFFAHGAAHAAFASEARAFQFDNCNDYLVDHCDMANEAGQGSLIGSSNGTFVNWMDACGEFNTTISDATTYGNTRFIYEKRGTFSPVITFVTPGTFAVAYTTQSARWQRNGNTVTTRIVLQTSSFVLGTAAGALRVTGFPFTSKNVAGNESVAACACQNISKANYTSISARMPLNTNYVDFLASGPASGQVLTNVVVADTPNAGTMILQFTITQEI